MLKYKQNHTVMEQKTMSWKNLSQYDLADALLSDHASLKELDDVHQIIHWSEIEAMLSSLYASKRGQPAFPPLLVFKALLLQAWYNLKLHHGLSKARYMRLERNRCRAQLMAMSHNI